METRRSVLAEELQYKETVMKLASVNGMGLQARTGMEELFQKSREQCRILRELMQALEYEPVRAAIAEFLGKDEPELKQWQKDLMEGKRPKMFHDQEALRYLEMKEQQEIEDAASRMCRRDILDGEKQTLFFKEEDHETEKAE